MYAPFLAFIIEKLKELLDVPATDEARLWLQHSDKKILLKLTDTMGDNKSPSSVEDNDVSHFNRASILILILNKQ